MRLKATAILVGAVVASAFPTAVKNGALAQGSAIERFPPPLEETVRVPEFVPVINFSEFLLAVEQSSDRSTREAAEALSAKFASASPPSDTMTDAEPALLRPTRPAAATTPDPSRPALADASEAMPVPDPVHEVVAPAGEAESLPAVRVDYQTPRAAKAKALSPRADASDDSDERRESPKPSRPEKRRVMRQFAPAMGLGASGIKVIIRPRAERSERRERPARMEKMAYHAPSKAAAPDADDQRGIPGQAWEPLISNCAKTKRDCHGAGVCGC